MIDEWLYNPARTYGRSAVKYRAKEDLRGMGYIKLSQLQGHG